MLLLAVVSYGLYLPYRLWYAQPYSSVIPWTGTHTPLWSYFTHWGLFLFVIVSWMVWETREWMANTPLVSLRKLEKYTGLIIAGLAVLFLACLLLSVKIPGIENMPVAKQAAHREGRCPRLVHPTPGSLGRHLAPAPGAAGRQAPGVVLGGDGIAHHHDGRSGGGAG